MASANGLIYGTLAGTLVLFPGEPTVTDLPPPTTTSNKPRQPTLTDGQAIVAAIDRLNVTLHAILFELSSLHYVEGT